MDITYTQHALDRMAERGISQAQVEATIAAPIATIEANYGRTEYQGMIDRAGKSQLLRVLVEHNVVILVITVMATSKITKYGANP